MKENLDIANLFKKNDIYYLVIVSISGNTVHCSCERVTNIPGTNNGDFTLKVGIGLYDNNNHTSDNIYFEWKMKDGINEYKSTNLYNPIHLGSGFYSRNDWEVTDSSGNITHYIFDLQIKK